MNYSFHPHAEKELEEVERYYDNIREELGDRFRDEIQMAISRTTVRKLGILTRSKFLKFDDIRNKNRELAEVDIEKADYDLIRFEELANSLNDKFAIKFRYDTFCKYVLPQLAVKD